MSNLRYKIMLLLLTLISIQEVTYSQDLASEFFVARTELMVEPSDSHPVFNLSQYFNAEVEPSQPFYSDLFNARFWSLVNLTIRIEKQHTTFNFIVKPSLEKRKFQVLRIAEDPAHLS